MVQKDVLPSSEGTSFTIAMGNAFIGYLCAQADGKAFREHFKMAALQTTTACCAHAFVSEGNAEKDHDFCGDDVTTDVTNTCDLLDLAAGEDTANDVTSDVTNTCDLLDLSDGEDTEDDVSSRSGETRPRHADFTEAEVITVTACPVYVLHCYQETAARLSRLHRDQPQSPMERAVWWVEHVMKHGGLPHLRPRAVELTWYQYYLLDVAVFLLAVCSTVSSFNFTSTNGPFGKAVPTVVSQPESLEETCEDYMIFDESTKECKNMSTTVGTETGSLNCPPDTVPFSNSCYILMDQSADYMTARKICETGGGYLVVVKDEAEHQFLIEHINSTVDIWIGLDDIINEGTFMYNDGSPLGVFTKWAYGEPNDATGIQDCVHLWPLAGMTWDDTICTKEKLFVCEFEK
ncbi:COLEC11 [Branchiostoma lanceolatum]|uniref:COLEC11 protein n=1 Tax=Branchiostoma lanceolatum TaxID=7740 RepID=A0A8J9YZJ2_BRALA|nr:COLEC11 [Branchiostoma lanceolatum]